MKNRISVDTLLSVQTLRFDTSRRSAWMGFALVVAVLVLAFATTPLLAQDVDPSTITADQVNEIASELWCPLCSGVRLDACELKACDQMKDEIAIKLAAGDGLPEIKTYFIDQYGPQVLGEPPREGFNLLAWVLPILVMVGGGIFLFTRGRKIFRSSDAAIAATPSADNAQGTDDGPSKDPYTNQLEEELKQYD